MAVGTTAKRFYALRLDMVCWTGLIGRLWWWRTKRQTPLCSPAARLLSSLVSAYMSLITAIQQLFRF